jgi:hypothetical protein
MTNKDKTKSELEFYSAEKFKEVKLEDDDKLQLRYAISNYGRLVSFRDSVENGRILKGSKQDGYRIMRYKIRYGKKKIRHKHCFYYKLVAEYFIPKTSDDQVYVLHLDRNRSNDRVENLRWATKSEMLEHSKKSPYVKMAKRKQLLRLAEYRLKRKHEGSKLNSTQVIGLKKKLLDPNRKTRLKILAKQFGVTTMTLHRIKTGENWGHIKVGYDSKNGTKDKME